MDDLILSSILSVFVTVSSVLCLWSVCNGEIRKKVNRLFIPAFALSWIPFVGWLVALIGIMLAMVYTGTYIVDEIDDKRKITNKKI